jgi:hypothetical protein
MQEAGIPNQNQATPPPTPAPNASPNLDAISFGGIPKADLSYVSKRSIVLPNSSKAR